jgi:TPR repeat protein
MFIVATQLDSERESEDILKERESNRARVVDLLRASAAQGHFVAQLYLARVLLDGTMGSQENEEAEAVGWLKSSAKQGFYKAQVALSSHHASNGRVAESTRWLTMAAEQRADPAVMHELGMLLCAAGTGTGGAQLEPEAGERWLEEAAQMGHPPSQLLMGRLSADAELSEMWLKKASGQGCHDATRALSWKYFSGGRLYSFFSLWRGWWGNFHHVSSKKIKGGAGMLPKLDMMSN